MTPEERQLIAGLFDRMRGYSLPQKDGEAEALINERVGAIADAPYMLVQSVLVQEHALQEAEKRIKALEEQVRTLEAGEPTAGAGSFLGGLFGGGRAASEPTRSGGSVPQIGARASPSTYDSRRAWTPPQGGPQAPLGAQQGAQPGGGGFLQTAMATAAGVAGGMLVAGAISSMLGGNSANASTADAAAGTAPEAPPAASDTAAAPPPPAQEEPTQEVADDDGGWFGGGGDDMDMGDFDI